MFLIFSCFAYFIILTMPLVISGLNVREYDSSPKVITSISSTLRYCDATSATGIQIPIFSFTNFTYFMKQYTLKNAKFTCHDGTEPDQGIIEGYPLVLGTSVSVSNQTTKHFEIIQNETILLDNEYLSVGNSYNYVRYYSPDQYCLQSVHLRSTNWNTVAVPQFRTCEFHTNRPMYPKCCPMGMAFTSDSGNNCEPISQGTSLELIDYLDGKTEKLQKFSEANVIYTKRLLHSNICERWESDGCNIVFHPVTDNRVAYKKIDRTWEFMPVNVPVCFESIVSNISKRFTMIYCDDTNNRTDSLIEPTTWTPHVSFAYMICMYIGSVFSFLTALVYIVTWKLQNLHGRILCSCTVAFFFMQISRGTTLSLELYATGPSNLSCIFAGIIAQYFMIASFTWLLVVNLDLWLTFRSINPVHQSQRRFYSYSVFGWGLPFVVSLVSIMLNEFVSCRISGIPTPSYGKVNCFLAPWAHGYYLYYILAILIALCYFLVAITLFSFYAHKRNASELRQTKNAAEESTVFLLLKLCLLMGLTWIFEVIRWARTESEEFHVVYFVLDVYNFLSSILIFIIFVCKKNTMNLLEESIPFLKGILQKYKWCD